MTTSSLLSFRAGLCQQRIVTFSPKSEAISKHGTRIVSSTYIHTPVVQCNAHLIPPSLDHAAYGALQHGHLHGGVGRLLLRRRRRGPGHVVAVVSGGIGQIHPGPGRNKNRHCSALSSITTVGTCLEAGSIGSIPLLTTWRTENRENCVWKSCQACRQKLLYSTSTKPRRTGKGGRKEFHCNPILNC